MMLIWSKTNHEEWIAQVSYQNPLNKWTNKTQAFFSIPKVPPQEGIGILQRHQCIRPMVLATAQCEEAENQKKMEVAEGTIDIIRCQVMTVNVPHEGFYAK